MKLKSYIRGLEILHNTSSSVKDYLAKELPSLKDINENGLPNNYEQLFDFAYFPNQIAKFYKFPQTVTGKGQSIAIISYGGKYSQGTLQKYFEQDLKMKVPKIKNVYVGYDTENQKDGLCNDFSANVELYLDIEVIGAVANDAQIVVYIANNSSEDNFIKAIEQAVSDSNNNSVVSISWGGPEGEWSREKIERINEIFEKASLKEITVCASSGDCGSEDTMSAHKQQCDFPASSPYVLACGGTRFWLKDNEIYKEVAWNDGVLGCTGGGISDVFDTPGYQSEAGLHLKSPNTGNPGRGIPDIAASASIHCGYKVRFDFLFGNILFPLGGTSAVAPLISALIALINEKSGKRVGFINPFLYRLKETKGVFRDIIEGNNGYYKAEKGWDACTGWGSPNGSVLADLIGKWKMI